MTLTSASGNTTRRAKSEARGHVHLSQVASQDARGARAPAPGTVAAGKTELFGDAMDFWIKSGQVARLGGDGRPGPGGDRPCRAAGDSAAQAVWSSGEWVSWRAPVTEVRAEHFRARFDEQGHMQDAARRRLPGLV